MGHSRHYPHLHQNRRTRDAGKGVPPSLSNAVNREEFHDRYHYRRSCCRTTEVAVNVVVVDDGVNGVTENHGRGEYPYLS